MAHLKIHTIDGERTVELKTLTTIGRLTSNGVVVRGSAVSKEHCTIEQRGDEFLLRDLNSRNGTFVNGVKLARDVVIKAGDVILLGHEDVRLVVEDAVVSQSSGPR